MSNRTDQDQFLSHYQGGYIGLTATPGAGKTTVLVRLIGQLLDQGVAISNILVLSYTRAASLNFRERLIRAYPKLASQSLEHIGTIHSCALRLIRPHLSRWGYTDRSLSPVLALQRKSFLEEAVQPWLVGKEAQWQRFLVPDHSPEARRQWQNKLIDLAEEGISLAKQQQLTPAMVENLSIQHPERFFLRLTSAVYTPFQQWLQEFNLLDFDDMVNLAIQLLQEETDLREQWQTNYQYLLEDEAQDSTPAQHRLLTLLAGAQGNWIRVGDPNQAIFSSFTAADPRFLIDFCQENAQAQLTQAGRSVAPIFELANWFLAQVCQDHPHPVARTAFQRQLIQATDQNPAPTPHSQPRALWCQDRTSEVQTVLTRANRYLRAYPHHSVAILAFSHKSLDEFAQQLQQADLVFIDRRQGSAAQFFTRLADLVGWVYDPFRKVGDLWLQLGKFTRRPLVVSLFAQMDPVPWLNGDCPWEQLPQWTRLEPADRHEVVRVAESLRKLYQRRGEPLVDFWLAASELLDPSPEATATAENLALNLLASGQARTLPQLAQLLQRQRSRAWLLAQSSRTPADGEEVPGQLELCTLHSAKGREWDAVFVTGITSYWFPTDHSGSFQGQLEYVTIYPQAQLKSEVSVADSTQDFAAQMKDDIITERLRLLYVGMTRARYYLSLSSHGPPALVFQWIQEFLEPPPPVG